MSSTIIPLIALSLLTAPLTTAYPITGNVVNCRSGPGTSYDVVKSYKLDADVSIKCQASGTDVNGDSIWDKTSDGCYVADYYVKTGSSSYVTTKCDGGDGGDGGDDDDDDNDGGSSGGNLPGLSSTQSKHAKAIIAEAKKEDLGRQGCTAGIATAIVESNILIYANNAVPESLKYPHDKVGSDHDSVGIFQQRAMFYKDIAADMDAGKSAGQFYEKMKGISGWKSMDVGKLCQKVQGSAYPSRYAEQVSKAAKICKAGGL